MPHYNVTMEIAHPLPELFSFLTKPTNLVQLAPPDLNLQLVTAPVVLALGSRLIWKGKRWGISQEITQEIVTFHTDQLIVLEQMKGPFAKWVHSSQFEPLEEKTKIHEKIEFEPPGGLLGYVLTADKIRKDLEKLLAYRDKRLKEMLG